MTFTKTITNTVKTNGTISRKDLIEFLRWKGILPDSMALPDEEVHFFVKCENLNAFKFDNCMLVVSWQKENSILVAYPRPDKKSL